jgi:hypothetical protein
MTFLRAVTFGFILLEIANVTVLYFFPGTKYANGVGVFRVWEKTKSDPEIHNFVLYLVHWVAGTKLIFLLLLLVILFTGQGQELVWMGAAMTVAVSSFFWRLFPRIRKMDRQKQIDPQGYSRRLAWMISGMIILFLTGTLLAL